MTTPPTAHWSQPAVLRAFASLQTPGLAIDLGRVRANVAAILRRLGDDPDRWRPHVKTLKVPAAMAEVYAAGVRAFKAATPREVAALLGVAPDADVLLAQPLGGPGLDRLVEIARGRAAARVSVLCEDPDAAERLPEPLGCYVDVNVGMDRTGIPLDDRARIHAVARAAAGRLRGVHAYEGHVLGDLDARRRRAAPLHDAICELVRGLADAGHAVGEVVTSGTPGMTPALEHAGLGALPGTRHRVSPGTVVYHDWRSATTVTELDDLVPAALVATRVLSRPRADVVTCDAGSKALAAEVAGPAACVVGRPDLEPLTPSEEHLPLRVAAGAPPVTGDLLLLVPTHVCPTVNLAERALVVDGERVVGVVTVAARAHELDQRG